MALKWPKMATKSPFWAENATEEYEGSSVAVTSAIFGA